MRQSNNSSELLAETGVAAPISSKLEAARPLSSGATGLPQRDYVLIPFLSLLTVVLLFAGTEITTRILWPASERGYCMQLDPITGPHGKPDCVSTVKIPEAPETVVHRFNHCGYRSEASCGPKAPGVFRIAVLGSSIAEGYMIPYRDMLVNQLTENLKKFWSSDVEFENLAAEACPPIYSYRHIKEALSLEPDAVVLVLNPWDLEQDVEPKLMALRDDPSPITRAPAPVVKLSPIQQLQAWARESRTMLVAQHYLLQNQDTFIKLYLIAGGDHTAFIRYPFPESWRKRFDITDILLGEMCAKIRAAGATFLVIGVPERAQVLMLRQHDLPPGIDPRAFTRELSRIAAKYGISFVDGLDALSRFPDPEKLFYVVDGHPTPLAHRILGAAAARELMATTSN